MITLAILLLLGLALTIFTIISVVVVGSVGFTNEGGKNDKYRYYSV